MYIFTKQNVYRRRIFPCHPNGFIRSVLPGVQYPMKTSDHWIPRRRFHGWSNVDKWNIAGTLLEPINLV